MHFGPLLCLIFIIVWSVSLFTHTEALWDLLFLNAGLQLLLFVSVACIPYLKTQRMSYVDIAWPFGVALIGVQIITLGDGDTLRRTVVGAVYLLIGLRMGIGAVTMGLKTGVIFKTEFPRNTYRHKVLADSGSRHIRFHVLAEMMAQGLANASVLALPGFLLAVNAAASISSWELAGLAIWLVAYCVESTADAQKLLFINKHPGGVCNVGLWRYSRHPNYFAEWLVWTGLVVAAVPSWLALRVIEPVPVWLALGGGAVCASVMMYITLNYLTGAVPAEYYSVQKRPEYRDYQQRTNMFFPWFPKRGAPDRNR